MFFHNFRVLRMKTNLTWIPEALAPHFFLLKFFSNSAQLAVRAFCPKRTPLTSALVKVTDVAGLNWLCPYDYLAPESTFLTIKNAQDMEEKF